MELIRNIEELMQKEDLSKYKLAKVSGIPYTTLIKILDGTTKNPQIESLTAIADHFNVSVDHLLGLGGSNELPFPKKTFPGGAPETYPVGELVKIPIIGIVTAGPDGLAYEDYQGEEWTEKDAVKGGKYFYLQVKGDSMLNEGILPGDLALIRETPEVPYGALAVAIVDDEEGTIKRVFKNGDNIILQASNPKYQPHVFRKKEMGRVRIVGEVKRTVRRY